MVLELLLGHRSNSLIKLSFASVFLAVLLPAIIILYDSIMTAMSIKIPATLANILYQVIVFDHSSSVNGATELASTPLLKINSSQSLKPIPIVSDVQRSKIACAIPPSIPCYYFLEHASVPRCLSVQRSQFPQMKQGIRKQAKKVLLLQLQNFLKSYSLNFSYLLRQGKRQHTIFNLAYRHPPFKQFFIFILCENKILFIICYFKFHCCN